MITYFAPVVRSVSTIGGGMDQGLLDRRALFIGGEWAEPAAAERFGVGAPSTAEVVGWVPLAGAADVDRAVVAARAAFDTGEWPRTPPAERAKILARAAHLLAERAPDIAEVTTHEMGCAISQAPQAQTGMVGRVFEYYAGLLDTYEFERLVVTDDRAGIVVNDPVGVVAAIVPWNAPV